MPSSLCLHALLMAGGSGTRFWPLSRKAFPKQFLHLDKSRSMLQATWDRLEGAVPHDRRWVVSTQAHAGHIAQVLPGLLPEHLLVEPAAKNTAPAIAFALTQILKTAPDATVAVLPADHFIRDEAAFREALVKAALVAQKGGIVTLGVVPERAETGFGYIERGARRLSGAYDVKRFVEKPDAITAECFVASGDFYWNSGIFVFQAAHMMQALRTHAPHIAQLMDETPAAQQTLFQSLSPVSIDYAVIEKCEDLAVVPMACGWSDAGSFDALCEMIESDEHQNAVSGDVLTIDAKNNIVHNETGAKVCIIGADDLIVINTRDALLILPRSQSQRVRDVVNALEKDSPHLL